MCTKTLAASSVAVLSVVLVAACADSDVGALAPPPDGSASVVPANDGGGAPVDAGSDASDGAVTDAGPRLCSVDDFCLTSVPSNRTLQTVWADGAGMAWAGTKEGAILRWDGTQWTQVQAGLGEIRTIWGSSPTEIWAVGAAGIYRGHGDTSASVAFSPSLLPEDGPVNIASIWGTGPSDVWAVGQRTDGASPAGRVYHYTGPSADPATSSWSPDPLSDDPTMTYERVWGAPGSGVWISGTMEPLNPWESGLQRVLRRAPADTSFSDVALPGWEDDFLPDGVPATISGATALSDTEVWLLVETDWYRTGYYRGVSSDNGATFTWSIIPYERIPEFAYTAIAGSASDLWAVGEYGRVEKWDGTTFTQASIAATGVPIIDPFYGIWTTNGEVWAVGKGIALHRAKK